MYKNKAFISYRHAPRDMMIAKLLQRRLEEYRIPREIAVARGMNRVGRIFRDQTDLGAQPNLSEELRKELEESEFLIVICSPGAARSRWVLEEVAYFLKCHGAERIIPVLSEGEPTVVLADMFENMNGIPGEMIACDCRGSRMRIVREEIPRIASSLIGCSYDDLRGRHRRYQIKRAAIATAVVFSLVAVFFAYDAANKARLRRSLDERMTEESKNLSKLSEKSLAEGDRFGAIRYALDALPADDKERPVVGDAVLAMQRAVGAYVPENRDELVQTGEYIVDGQIDEWDCLETEKGSYLAVQYGDVGRFDLALWKLGSPDRIIDTRRETFQETGAEIGQIEDGKENRIDDAAFLQNGNFLMCPDMILWSSGGCLYALDMDNGDILWTEMVEDAEQMTLLVEKGGVFAVHVYGSSGAGFTEELQFRKKEDGKLLEKGVVKTGWEEQETGQEGYMEIPGAVFSDDGKSLILEEKIRCYSESSGDFDSLYLVELSSMQKRLLLREREILNFQFLQDGKLVVVTGGSELSIKSVSIQTGQIVWENDGLGSPEDYKCLIQGKGPVLVSGNKAISFERATGRELAFQEFPEAAVTAFMGKGAEKDLLYVVSEKGNNYTWNLSDGEASSQTSAFPDMVCEALQACGSIFIYCSGESLPASEDRILLFGKNACGSGLTKVSIPKTDTVLSSDVVSVIEFEGQFMLLTDQGKVFGIDAGSGEVLWSSDPGEDVDSFSFSETEGKLAVRACLRKDNAGDRPAWESWTILDIKNGKTERVSIPPEKVIEGTGQMSCPVFTLAGSYLEFIALFHPESKNSADKDKIIAVRYSLSDKRLSLIDLTDSVGDPSGLFYLYGNEKGKNAFCFCQRTDSGSEDQIILLNWETGAAELLENYDNSSMIHNSYSGWSGDGRHLAVMDGKNRIHLLGTDGSNNIWVPGKSKEKWDEAGQEGDDIEKESVIVVGHDYLDDRIVTVEVEKNRLWFHDDKAGVHIELPCSEGNAMDPQMAGEFMGETEVSAFQIGNGKIFLKYGDEGFVLDEEGGCVETAMNGLLAYSPQADTVFLDYEGEQYISKRFDWQELVRMGRQILHGSGQTSQ